MCLAPFQVNRQLIDPFTELRTGPTHNNIETCINRKQAADRWIRESETVPFGSALTNMEGVLI